MKEKRSPPGNSCGSTCAHLRFRQAVVTVGRRAAPAADFQDAWAGCKKDRSVSAHVAPHPTPDTSAIRSQAASGSRYFLELVLPGPESISYRPAKKNGPPEPSVTDSGFAATAVRARAHRVCVIAPLLPATTTCRHIRADTAIAVCAGRK